MRLIDADEFISYLIGRYGGNDTGDEIIEDLYNQPTVDAVQVVRCKDCKHYRELGRATGICAINDIEHRLFADWFCADGEREERTERREP